MWVRLKRRGVRPKPRDKKLGATTNVFDSLGFETGVEAANPTESQFGVGIQDSAIILALHKQRSIAGRLGERAKSTRSLIAHWLEAPTADANQKDRRISASLSC